MITCRKITDLNRKEIILFRLANDSGAFVEILNYGATVTSIVVPDKNNRLSNVILTYNDPEDYFSDNAYLGSTVGRVANRISKAQFELDGHRYLLDRNDGNNSNHGGFNGFNKRIFDFEIQNNQLTLSCESKDGEGGFPGNMRFSVIYSFSEKNELTMEYKAVSDKITVFNPTNHTYFNLSGKKQNILNHKLKIFSGSYLESDNEFLPTGRILLVEKTAFDFTGYQEIAEMMPLKNELLEGYNTYFIGFEKADGPLRKLASVREEISGREVVLYSDMPGFMFYTGDYLSGKHQSFEGLCLEAQFYPDAPNHPDFPSCKIDPDREMAYKIRYEFLIFDTNKI